MIDGKPHEQYSSLFSTTWKRYNDGCVLYHHFILSDKLQCCLFGYCGHRDRHPSTCTSSGDLYHFKQATMMVSLVAMNVFQLQGITLIRSGQWLRKIHNALHLVTRTVTSCTVSAYLKVMREIRKSGGGGRFTFLRCRVGQAMRSRCVSTLFDRRGVLFFGSVTLSRQILNAGILISFRHITINGHSCWL